MYWFIPFLFCLSRVLETTSVDCSNLGYPRQYIAYKLLEGEKIKFDGIIDEVAWNVSWSEPFVDIQGSARPPPYFETKIKMRWDDTYLYIGGLLQEPQSWANLTVNNSVVFYDNDFEVFIDPDGCNHFYKELEMNVFNVNWNLLLVRPYLNGGPAVCNFTVPNECQANAPGVPFWDIAPYLPSGTYVKGKINDPVTGSVFWSIEIGIPLQQYVMYNKYSSFPPKVGSYWRINFSRVEWHINVHRLSNGTSVYWKDVTKPEENWVWQATYVDPPDMHLPETWGYLQFADGPINETTLRRDPQWPVRDALMQVYNALTVYHSIHAQYTTDLEVLVAGAFLPEYVAQGMCSTAPVIVLSQSQDEFIATSEKGGMVGHVRNDRYLWFESPIQIIN